MTEVLTSWAEELFVKLWNNFILPRNGSNGLELLPPYVALTWFWFRWLMVYSYSFSGQFCGTISLKYFFGCFEWPVIRLLTWYLTTSNILWFSFEKSFCANLPGSPIFLILDGKPPSLLESIVLCILGRLFCYCSKLCLFWALSTVFWETVLAFDVIRLSLFSILFLSWICEKAGFYLMAFY